MDNSVKENSSNINNVKTILNIKSNNNSSSSLKYDFNSFDNGKEDIDSGNSIEVYLDSVWEDAMYEIKYGYHFKKVTEEQVLINAEKKFMRSFKCCGLRFERKNQYLEHKYIQHVDQNTDDSQKQDLSFTCNVKGCEKVYTSAYGLKYHLEKGHSKKEDDLIKPYVCTLPNCKKRYKNSNGLKYHIKNGHNKKKNN